jgi:hypothetical protein
MIDRQRVFVAFLDVILPHIEPVEVSLPRLNERPDPCERQTIHDSSYKPDL